MSDQTPDPAAPTTLNIDDIVKLRKANEPASLDTLSDTASSNFEEDIARANQLLKERIAKDIMRFMGISLGVTLILTLLLATIDAAFIGLEIIEPSDRLITENVVMAVIGATVVQVGAASIAIVYSLFGQPKAQEGSD